MRRWVLVVVGLASAVVGAGASLAIEDGPAVPSRPEVETVPVPVAADGLLLAWTSGGLPAGLAEGVRAIAGVRAVTEVRGGPVDLLRSIDADGRTVDEPAPGWSIPLDAIAIDPVTYASFPPPDSGGRLGGLGTGEVLLGSTSARIRGLGAGASLQLGAGPPVSVVGVVDDRAVGGAEIVLSGDDVARYGITVGRYLLIRYRGDRQALEQSVRTLLQPARPIRFRAPGETPFLREGDAVLPQALVKERFGEFAMKRTDDRDIEQDPAWIADNITTTEVPVLGRVRCHRVFLPAFAGALRELEQEGLGYLVDRAGFAGCWAPRLVDEGGALSRHAWGVAFDINILKNAVGSGSAQDPRLVAIMRRWGLTFGGSWLQPDPAHFEYLRPPTGS